MTPEEYHLALDTIVSDMRQLGISAECRGSGPARFIYAERGLRAVEVSALQPAHPLKHSRMAETSPSPTPLTPSTPPLPKPSPD